MSASEILLYEAEAKSKKAASPLELLIKDNDYHRTVRVDYQRRRALTSFGARRIEASCVGAHYCAESQELAVKQISASVGLLGVNRQEDVRTVQELLNQVPYAGGGPLKKLELDGICGRKTNGAIEKLQARNWGWRRVTTRVDPDSATWKLLLSYDRSAEAGSGPVTPAADPPKADPPRLVSRSFMIAMAARPGQQLNVNGENFYFLITDRFNQSQRALYFFGNMNAPPPPPQPLTWSITIPPVVTTPEPIGASDWAGDGTFTETQDSSGVRSRMFVFPTVLNRHGVGFELRAHLDEPSSGPGRWSTSSSAPFSLVDALTVYYWQKDGKLQL